ncbi:MAG: hypothetical protein SNJ76_12265, partial [Fimbriimonadaceae bacterium]
MVAIENQELARWVRQIARARDQNCEIIADPRDELVTRYPSLAPFVRELLPDDDREEIEPLWGLLRRRLPSLPDATEPSVRHAESVARWRVGNPIDEGLHALLIEACRELSTLGHRKLYELVATASNEELILHIVGEADPAFESECDGHQVNLLYDSLTTWARSRLASNGFAGLRTAMTRSAPLAIKRLLAQEVVKAAKTLDLAAADVRLLVPFLKPEDKKKLDAHVQPGRPSDVPTVAEELGAWYEESYLPYREWMHANGIASDEHAERCWQQFAERFLALVSDSLGSGRGELA